MKISELTTVLDAFKAKHGDIEVKVQTLSHLWEPEPVVKTNGAHQWPVWVLLNP